VRIDGACDDIGLDTIDVGAAAAVAMEAGRIPWGDGARVLEVLESIRRDGPRGCDRERVRRHGEDPRSRKGPRGQGAVAVRVRPPGPQGDRRHVRHRPDGGRPEDLDKMFS